MAIRIHRAITAVFFLLVACRRSPPIGDRADAGDSDLPGGLTHELAAHVLAKVGDRAITLGDYAAALERMNEFDRLRYQSPEKRRELLNEMIDLELLANEAQRLGLTNTPETQAAIRQILRDAMLDDLRRAQPTADQIPAEDVRVYYEKNRDEFREPERRRVAALIFSDPKEAHAVLPLAQKASPIEWGKLYQAHGEGRRSPLPSSQPLETLGDLGIVGPPDDPKGDNVRVPSAVRAALFEMPPELGGVLNRLVETNGKFYVLKLVGRSAPHERTLAEAERSIRGILFQQRVEQAEKTAEEDLKKRFPVVVDNAALANVRVPDDNAVAPHAASASPKPGSSGPPR